MLAIMLATSAAAQVKLFEIEAADKNKIVITEEVNGVFEQVYKDVTYITDTLRSPAVDSISTIKNFDGLVTGIVVFNSDGTVDMINTNELPAGEFGQFLTNGQNNTTYWSSLDGFPSNGVDGDILVSRADLFGGINYQLEQLPVQLTEAEVDGFTDNNGYLEAEVDGSITNEAQTLTGSGNTITLSDVNGAGGGSYTVPNDTINIYDNDGILSGNRFVDFGGHTLEFGTFGNDLILDCNVWLDDDKKYGWTHNNSTIMSATIGGVNQGQVFRLIGGSGVSNQIKQFSTGATADNFPAHSFTADTNTGMALFGQDQLSLTTGAVTRILVSNDGVGIGTNNPTHNLDIFQVGGATAMIRGNTAASSSELRIGTTGSRFWGFRAMPFGSNKYDFELNYLGGSFGGDFHVGDGTSKFLTVKNDGTIAFPDYGSGNNTGALTRVLGVQSNGDIIEVDPNAIGSLQLTEAEVDAFTDNNGYLETEVDGSITNEAQTLTGSGNTITLSDVNGAGGGSYTVNDTQLTTEQVQDAAAAMMAGSGGINVNYNDSGNLLIISGNGSSGADGVVTGITETFNSSLGTNRLHTFARSNGLPAINFVFKDLTSFKTFGGSGGITNIVPNVVNQTNIQLGIGVTDPLDMLHVGGTVRIDGRIKDEDGDAGLSGQVLTATSTGVDWADSNTGGLGAAQLNNPTGNPISTSVTTWETLNFGSGGNNGGSLSASSGSDRITNNTSGLIQVNVSAMLKYSGDIGASVDVGLFLNGNSNPFRDYRYYLNMVDNNSFSLNAIVNLSSGDYITLKSRQTSTSSTQRVDDLQPDSTFFAVRID